MMTQLGRNVTRLEFVVFVFFKLDSQISICYSRTKLLRIISDFLEEYRSRNNWRIYMLLSKVENNAIVIVLQKLFQS